MLLLPALWPLSYGPFFESHDGDFHLYRLAALDQAVRAGVLYPRWFPDFAFGYGQPVLNFYGPLSYYWGLPFTLLGADAALGMKLVLATGLIASALSLYLFARLHLDRGPALVAAVVYAYLPYHLIDLYIRGAVAEFLAFVWFPLILWAFHRLVKAEGRDARFVYLALGALLFTALITTHSLSALIFAPVLAGYLLVLLRRRRFARPALLAVILALLLTAALSAFYWLPVLTESEYVGLGHGASQGYQNHLLPPGDLFAWDAVYDYAVENPIVFRLGWVQAAILIASLLLLLRRSGRRWFLAFWLLTAAASILMLTTAALPLWRLFEAGLAFLQYPWRFQAITVLATALLSGAIFQATTRPAGWGRWAAGAVAVLVTMTWALGSLPVTLSSPDLTVEGMWHKDRALNQIGATWTGEYVPIWVREQRWAISHPASETTLNTPVEPVTLPGPTGGALRLTGVGYTRYEMTLDAPQGADLVLHQFYFPGWQARWQGQTIPARPSGALGLARFDLPPGQGPLTLRLALTPPQWGGMLLSLITALAVGPTLIAVCGFRRRGSGCPAVPGFVGAAFYLLLAAILLAGWLWPNGRLRPTQPVRANLANLVELQAFEIDTLRYLPGDTVEVTLYWVAQDALEQDYKTFIHLTNAEVTRQPTQHDDDPGGSFTPTSRWLPGEIVPDTHYLPLPADLPPGRYNLWADMYEYPAVRNLVVLAADAPTDGRRVLLTQIQVVAP